MRTLLLLFTRAPDLAASQRRDAIPGARSLIFPAYKRQGGCYAFLIRFACIRAPAFGELQVALPESLMRSVATPPSHLSLAECRHAALAWVGVMTAIKWTIGSL